VDKYVAQIHKKLPSWAKKSRSKRQSWYYYHKVKYPGESLSIIAKWYTGDVKNWPFLAKVNPELDPNRITVGDKIRIPNKLLHIQKPMPRSFIAGSAKRKKSEPSQVKTAKTAKKEPEPSTTGPPDKQPEVFELFGPK
jgi:hypothetical protein